MSRYLQSEEENMRMQALVREWTRSGLLEQSQSTRLEADLRVDLRRTNQFLRAILLVFTALIVGASVALIVMVFDLNGERPLAATFLVSALACFGLAEYLVSRYRVYRFGVEEALSAAAVVLVSVGVTILVTTGGGVLRYQGAVVAGLSVGAAGAFGIYRRFGYVYAALASILCAAAIPFQLLLSAEMERTLAAAVLALVFFVGRSKRLSYGDEFPGDDYGILQAFAWAGLYIALNLQLTPHQTAWAFYWGTYAMIWILPIVGLGLALRDRDRPLLDVSLAMALATLMTNKPYLGLSRKPWDPILFGIFLAAVAIAIRKWLSKGTAGERHGFTSARILAGDRRLLTLVGTASAAFQPGMPQPEPAPSKPGLDGGRSGGAGASGGF